ncbi:MAG: nucleotidyl transferase AbiEii/AbiGii toxin family protein [Desulfobacteraceae bacterium]|nr:nucleotidyl transferase AbiEii/AbiGii toxin family protein [Desulfobacteraceae bacterium]
MFEKTRVKKSEALQLILLDNLYAQSGSEHIIFQGGTALRWVYSGMRFSEDLDFVTHLQAGDLEKILSKMFQNTKNACTAQFGPGRAEYKIKGIRKQATKMFFIYRPEGQRERIAVRLEFETLKSGHDPECDKYILRDLPLVAGMVTGGELVIPYSSSIVLAETPEEILSDKIRAIYERNFLKGRDIYDIWWIVKQLKVVPEWIKTREKLFMYQTSFIPAREADFFQKKGSISGIVSAMKTDLPRFIPRDILSMYQDDDFSDFIAVLKEVTLDLLDQGMKKYFEHHERRKDKP